MAIEIRDPIHGSIEIYDDERPILEHQFFQRLRRIKQLGLSEFAFPGATHTRYLHSIGVMTVATKAFNYLFRHFSQDADYHRLKESVRLAALLHDIGHAPLSHSTESVMPKLKELNLPEKFYKLLDVSPEEQATHEHYTLKSLTDSSFLEAFPLAEKKFGISSERIAEIILGKTTDPDYFTIKNVNYFPLLHQLVSGELDCDRMDYLLRDSYYCGVSYGNYDLDWIIHNLQICVEEGQGHLGLADKALQSFDDFLLGRYHMFLMVYFHYRAVCLEKMLYRYFYTSPLEYNIPANIEEYQKHDDAFLLKFLKNSFNPWAKKIIKNEIPPILYESRGVDTHIVDQLTTYLEDQKIEFLKCSSKGRISKYYSDEEFDQEKFPMKVIKHQIGTDKKKVTNLHSATNLFQKFSEAYSVTRLHTDFSHLNSNQQKNIRQILQQHQ